ncbi:MAG TPA: hydrogenase maturation protein [Casimicrobiaceae bacterium]|nr:hydrogenase maturation protein [Casimicrobiaceae bacterium]
MRILLLTHAFNSLTQRLYVELAEAGHSVSIEFDVNDRVTEEAVAMFRPDAIVAPFLKRAIPESVWRRDRCIVVHPGIPGDRGPSALDWAVLRGEREWGVTALQANGEMDAGDIWASAAFPMREASKSSLYRHEVTEAAAACLQATLARLDDPAFAPTPLDYSRPEVRGRLQPPMRQADRAIEWRHDDTAKILRKIRAADGSPGVRDEIAGLACHLYDAHREGLLRGVPGTIIARRERAVCRATVDGAVWITHLKRADVAGAFKLPATMVLGDAIASIPEKALAPQAVVDYPTWRPIRYEEAGAVGLLHFPFYNGAMDTTQCEALRSAYAYARSRPTRVIALTGGDEFWSNGIHLNVIEASAHPAEESWRNINAIDDLVRDIVATDGQITLAALCGNAGAGGAFLALAADHVFARDGVILNPHYKSMGNLYGSEYWTYLLPRRVDRERALAIVENRLPIGVRQAKRMGLIDDHFAADPAAFRAEVARRAAALASDSGFARRIAEKNRRRAADESVKPLDAYRAEELERMKLNFFGFDSSYHVARFNFVHKVPRSRTPSHLAVHRVRMPRADGTLCSANAQRPAGAEPPPGREASAARLAD